MPRKSDVEARVLSPSEYPASITAPWGTRVPRVLFAAQHPLGIYHVEDHGAGVHVVYFTARRSKRPKVIGSARGVAGAFCVISEHEDQLVHPAVAREGGRAIDRRRPRCPRCRQHRP